MRKVDVETNLTIATKLLTIQLSDDPEDYPKTMPKWVLRMIGEHNEKQIAWAVELKKIHDKQKEAERG